MDTAGMWVGALVIAEEPTTERIVEAQKALSEEQKLFLMLAVAEGSTLDPAIREFMNYLRSRPIAERRELLAKMPDVIRARLLEGFAQIQETQQKKGMGNIRWHLTVFLFTRFQRRLVTIPCEHVFLVDGTGQIQPTGMKDADGRPSAFMSMGFGDRLPDLGTPCSSFFVPMLTLSFINCRNVKLVTTHRPASDRPPKTPEWTTTYRELQLEGIRKLLDETKREVGIGTLQRALHIVRGHFASYTKDRGLFGKYQGQFWRPQHRRGSADAGIVEKSYIPPVPPVARRSTTREA
jgi:hypothetical protein